MAYNLTINGIKLCRACNMEKPLSEFPVKKRSDGRLSYGRCKLCTLMYDHDRRRKKGTRQRRIKEAVSKPIIVALMPNKDRARIYQMKKRLNVIGIAHSVAFIHQDICEDNTSLIVPSLTTSPLYLKVESTVTPTVNYYAEDATHLSLIR